MTASLSIFEKLCPSCATAITVSAERCSCGHVFESASDNAQEIALRDEELYENYLAARAAQAQEAARAARAALAEHPDDAEKSAAAELAQEVATSIDSDLSQQRHKVAALRAALEELKPKPATAPVVAQPVVAQPVVAQPVVAQPVVAQPVVAQPVVAQPVAIVAANPAPPHKPVVETKPAYRSAKPKTHEPLAAGASPVRARNSPAKSESAITVISAPAVEPPAPPAPQISSTTPLSSAARAASVLEMIKTAKAREQAARTPPVAEAHSQEPENNANTVPPAAFRAEQAARAEKAVAAHNHVDGKDCPNCTARVPTNTTRCRCGYAFVSGRDDLPSLTLCTGDFTALRDSLNLHLRRT